MAGGQEAWGVHWPSCALGLHAVGKGGASHWHSRAYGLHMEGRGAEEVAVGEAWAEGGGDALFILRPRVGKRRGGGEGHRRVAGARQLVEPGWRGPCRLSCTLSLLAVGGGRRTRRPPCTLSCIQREWSSGVGRAQAERAHLAHPARTLKGGPVAGIGMRVGGRGRCGRQLAVVSQLALMNGKRVMA